MKRRNFFGAAIAAVASLFGCKQAIPSFSSKAGTPREIAAQRAMEMGENLKAGGSVAMPSTVYPDTKLNRLTDDEILGALARAYCHPENHHKVLDGELLLAAAKEIKKL